MTHRHITLLLTVLFLVTAVSWGEALECPFGRRFCNHFHKIIPNLDFSLFLFPHPSRQSPEEGVMPVALCDPRYLLRGTVYRPEEEGGGGIEGAEVQFGYHEPGARLWDDKRLTALTDRQGRYEICAEGISEGSRSLSVAAVHGRYPLGRPEGRGGVILPGEGEEVVTDIRFEACPPEKILFGRITEGERGLEGARVRIEGENSVDGKSVSSESDGTYRICNDALSVFTGRVRFLVSKEGFLTERREHRWGDLPHENNFSLVSGGTPCPRDLLIEGRIVEEAEGGGVAGALVKTLNGFGENVETLSAEEGSFSLCARGAFLPGESVLLTVQAPGFRPTAQVVPLEGQDPLVTIAMRGVSSGRSGDVPEGLAVVRGRVCSDPVLTSYSWDSPSCDGFIAVPLMSVLLYVFQGERQDYRLIGAAITDEEGRYRMTFAPERGRTYYVRTLFDTLEGKGYLLRSLPVRPNRPHPMDIVLKKFSSFRLFAELRGVRLGTYRSARSEGGGTDPWRINLLASRSYGHGSFEMDLSRIGMRLFDLPSALLAPLRLDIWVVPMSDIGHSFPGLAAWGRDEEGPFGSLSLGSPVRFLAVIHEIGHVVDSLLIRDEESPFQEELAPLRELLFSPQRNGCLDENPPLPPTGYVSFYACTSGEEDFAETFRVYRDEGPLFRRRLGVTAEEVTPLILKREEEQVLVEGVVPPAVRDELLFKKYLFMKMLFERVRGEGPAQYDQVVLDNGMAY